MKTPAYYDAVPSIVMVDPLAQILGSAEDGLLDRSEARRVGKECED